MMKTRGNQHLVFLSVLYANLILLQVRAYPSTQVQFSPQVRSHGKVLFYVVIVAIRRMQWKENGLVELKCHSRLKTEVILFFKPSFIFCNRNFYRSSN
uniref:Transmembrane protein n=1 Tax=Medicago truncatula TaxID=3880 RepID=I3RZP7_MEDTR|nr:unknown [Medicago truncatula]